MSTSDSIAVMGDVTMLESLPTEQQELAVSMMLDQSKQWLDRAMEATNPAREVSDFKAFVATVAEASKQKKLSEGIQLDAVEMVRRAERSLAVAIRKGQDAGEIERHDEARSRAGKVARGTHQDGDDILMKAKPTDFAKSYELSHSNGGLYDLADGVSDEQFEEALAVAKEEGNLSRANVVRKVTELSTFREQQDEKWERVADLANQGYASSQIAREIGMTEKGLRDGAKRYNITFPADEYVSRSKRINSADVIERIVASLEADESVLGLVQFEDINPEQAAEWLQRLTSPLRAIAQMKKQLKEIS